MKYRVIIYKDKCIKCGACAEVAPEVFEFRAGRIIIKRPVISEGHVEIIKKVRRAVDVCPVMALDIIEEPV